MLSRYSWYFLSQLIEQNSTFFLLDLVVSSVAHFQPKLVIVVCIDFECAQCLGEVLSCQTIKMDGQSVAYF